jgi:hypothetical protein
VRSGKPLLRIRAELVEQQVPAVAEELAVVHCEDWKQNARRSPGVS